MLIYLDAWIVEDGQVPELSVGDRLAGVGVAMRGRRLSRSTGCDGLRDISVQATDPASLVSALDGEVVWRCAEPEGAVVRAGDVLVVTQGEWVDVARPPDIDFRLVPLGLPALGERVRVTGELSIMPKDELSARNAALPMVGAPDVRGDWMVQGIFVERREGLPQSDEVTQVERVDRMNVRSDGVYRLDLRATA